MRHALIAFLRGINVGGHHKEPVRTAETLRALVDADPFGGVAMHADIRLYITFTRSGGAVPSVLDLRDTASVKAMDELEKRLGKDITTRNWNTVVKLVSER